MNQVVIGLGFGDEGKGMFVDHLCPYHSNPKYLVVRFSGGHQVGHTVTDGINTHIFSNFGSGTLKSVPTYWSKYCTVEPVGLIREYLTLKEKRTYIRLYIDEKCPIVTPYDINHNLNQEKKNKHGSCGVGFGATINRQEHKYSLTYGDLFHKKIFLAKLDLIKKYYGNVNLDTKEFERASYIITNNNWIKKVTGLPEYDHYIFEGSQGLLLDQNFGFFPNVTRSNLGLKNVIEILGHNHFELFLISRAYQTRHGNGFMTNENIPHKILKNPIETNTYNKNQGKFRRSLLDIDLLHYAIEQDENIRKHKNKSIVITCLDLMKNDYRFTYNNRIMEYNNECNFLSDIKQKINSKFYIGEIYKSKLDNNIIKVC